MIDHSPSKCLTPPGKSPAENGDSQCGHLSAHRVTALPDFNEDVQEHPIIRQL
jgi:hypothetical protein